MGHKFGINGFILCITVQLKELNNALVGRGTDGSEDAHWWSGPLDMTEHDTLH